MCVRMRILLDLSPVILDPSAIAGDMDVGSAEAFAKVFGLQAEIVYGKARAGSSGMAPDPAVLVVPLSANRR